MYDLLTLNDRDLLLAALNNMISTKMPLRDRYGFVCYLKEKNNVYFLDKDISVNSDILMNEYVAKPYLVDLVPFDENLEILLLRNDIKRVVEICQNLNEEKWNELSYKTQILLMEKAFELLQNKVYDDNEEVEEVLQEIINLGGGEIKILKDGTIVHELYNREYTGIEYTGQTVLNEGRMRIFVEDEGKGKWQDLGDLEKEKDYAQQIKELSGETQLEGFKNNPYGVYGLVSKKTGKFRLVFKGKKNKGLVCGTGKAKFPLLIELFFKLGYLPRPREELRGIKDREILVKSIKSITKVPEEYKSDEFLDKYNINQLKQILTLYNMKIVGDEGSLCGELKRWFRDHQLLMEN